MFILRIHPSRVLTWLSAMLVAGILLGTGVPSAWAQTREAPERRMHTLAVNGEGSVRNPPDIAYISVGVNTRGDQATTAAAENDRLMAAVLETVRARGIEQRDIRTSFLNVNPYYEPGQPPHPQGSQKIAGYTAANSITITVRDLDRVGEVVTAALTAGANTVGSLRFDVRDPAALQQQARASAVRSARAAAERMAAEAGLRIVGIRNIEEPGGAGDYYRPAQSFPEVPVCCSPQGTPIEVGEMVVTARVRVVFEVR